MADTNSFETLLQYAIRRGQLGIVLLNADIGGIAAGTVTSVVRLRNARSFSTNEFSNRDTIIYRPGNATGVADMMRYAADLAPSTGVLDNDTDWSDTTLGSENIYLLYDALHPQDLVDAAGLADRIVYFENMEPLAPKPQGTALADAGMQAGTGQWVESDSDSGPATTIAAVTTANSSTVYTGIGSLSLTNTASNGYFRKRFDVTPGEQYIWHTLSKHSSGDNTFATAYDITNGASIDSITHDATSWQWGRLAFSIPSGCYTLETRHGNAGSSGVTFWNASAPLCPSHARLNLDTKWDTEFKMPKLVYQELGGQSDASGFYAAHASRMEPIPTSDYGFLFERPGANPYAIQFHNGSQEKWFQYPVYIQGRRAYSDVDTAPTLALTQTTSCDLDLFVWAWLKCLFQYVRPDLPNASERLAIANEEFMRQSAMFTQDGPSDQPARVVVSMGLRGA